jgi:hypothetical protein
LETPSVTCWQGSADKKPPGYFPGGFVLGCALPGRARLFRFFIWAEKSELLSKRQHNVRLEKFSVAADQRHIGSKGGEEYPSSVVCGELTEWPHSDVPSVT